MSQHNTSQPDMSQPSMSQPNWTQPQSQKTQCKSKMSPEEDMLLCRAYVQFSSDAIHGASQTKLSLWGNITDHYNSNRSPYPERSQASLQSRFNVISTAVKLYIAKYTHAINNLSSGKSEKDAVREAMAMYYVEKSQVFGYNHCVEILMSNAKFNPETTAHNSQMNRGMHGGEGADGMDVEGNHGECVPDSSSQPSSYTRPMGRDTARKLDAKRKAKDRATTNKSEEVRRSEERTAKLNESLSTLVSSSAKTTERWEKIVKYREEEQQRCSREEERAAREEERRAREEERRIREEERRAREEYRHECEFASREKEAVNREEMELVHLDESKLSARQKGVIDERWEKLKERKRAIEIREKHLQQQYGNQFPPHY